MSWLVSLFAIFFNKSQLLIDYFLNDNEVELESDNTNQNQMWTIGNFIYLFFFRWNKKYTCNNFDIKLQINYLINLPFLAFTMIRNVMSRY